MTIHADPAPILDLIEAFRRSKTMFTAVRLGIFDRLEEEPRSAVDLAAHLKVNVEALSRLLDACLGLHLLQRDDQVYRNTPRASKYLVSTSPDALAGYITYSDESLYQLWGHLDDAVREGTNRWAQAFGSREALFDHYFRDESAKRSFLGGMHGFGQIASRLVVRAFDLSRFSHLVDLGGATGHLAIAACEAYPKLHATVFDLPAVEAFSRSCIDNSPVRERITFVAGDFFDDTFPKGDLYALGRILHDWGEAKIGTLLQKISASLKSGGALLIAEALLNEERTGPVYALMQDLNMLVCTEGKERTPSEYRDLLEPHGFTAIDYRRTGSLVDAILAIKK
jgi:acetylserotonin N-methyltransferase